MIRIILTEQGQHVGSAHLYDGQDAWEWLELAFPDARTITLNNAGWIVDLEPRCPHCNSPRQGCGCGYDHAN